MRLGRHAGDFATTSTTPEHIVGAITGASGQQQASGNGVEAEQ
jgi:hypothetical protein